MKKNWKIILIISCCLFYWFGKKPVYQFLWGEYTGQQIEIGEEKFVLTLKDWNVENEKIETKLMTTSKVKAIIFLFINNPP